MMRIALGQRPHGAGFPQGVAAADIGCNGGYHGIRLLRDGAASCVFVDANPHSLAAAEEVARAWGVRGKASFWEMDAIGFGGVGLYDLVMAHQVIYHLSDPVGFLRRAHASLKEGGSLAMFTRIAHALHDKTFEWVPSWVAMEEALQHVGFRSVSIIGGEAEIARVHPKSRDIRSAGQEKVLVLAHR